MQTHSTGTLADAVVPRGNTLAFAVARDATLIAAGALLVAISAQINIPWYPVPFTGQTFAVLLVGGVLGAWRGAASLSLYALVGILGLPVFSEQSGGWTYFNGTTGGYIIGFIVAAALVGFLCERGADRNILSLLGALLLGNLVIFLFGAGWLANVTSPVTGEDFGWGAAYRLGVEPFLLGTLVKTGAVAALLPAGWALVGLLGLRRRSDEEQEEGAAS